MVPDNTSYRHLCGNGEKYEQIDQKMRIAQLIADGDYKALRIFLETGVIDSENGLAKRIMQAKE